MTTSPTTTPTRPEAVVYGTRVWAAAVALALVHEVLLIVTQIVDPGELLEQARQSAGPDMTVASIRTTVTALIVVIGSVRILILLAVAWGITTINRGRAKARHARLLLTYFAGFFAIQAAVVFAHDGAAPGAGAPAALVIADSVAQLLMAVAGILGCVYLFKKESTEYITAVSPPPPTAAR